ncbi:MAG: M48 family metalloprotease, partial [Gemmatimonadota bacterium]|nr:M48 family metalloprotease [Gemmatimonadota bacterium]
YPRARLVSREQTHRRTVLLWIGVLLLLVISPLFSHHLFRGTEAILAGRDHLGALCLIALHTLLQPVHELFHLLFVAGLLYAAWDRLRTWNRAREVLGVLDVRTPEVGDAFWCAARSAGVEPGAVRVAQGLPTAAFTVGWLRPRVFVAASLADRLEPNQLTAVFAHEGAHALRRDPLRLSLLRFLTCTLFWIPALRRLADDIADEAEIQADDAAAAGQPLVLASAIVALARSMEEFTVPYAAVGFHRSDLLERRVRRLLGEEPLPGSHLTRRSLVGATAALIVVFVSGAVMAHPLPAQTPSSHSEHCEHRSLSLFDITEPLGLLGHQCDQGMH